MAAMSEPRRHQPRGWLGLAASRRQIAANAAKLDAAIAANLKELRYGG